MAPGAGGTATVYALGDDNVRTTLVTFAPTSGTDLVLSQTNLNTAMALATTGREVIALELEMVAGSPAGPGWFIDDLELLLRKQSP